MLAALALAALALGWWAQAGLAAALLDAGRRPEAAPSLGLGPAPWLATIGAWGGIAGGWAGVVMAHAGAAPPSVTTGLILAAAGSGPGPLAQGPECVWQTTRIPRAARGRTAPPKSS